MLRLPSGELEGFVGAFAWSPSGPEGFIGVLAGTFSGAEGFACVLGSTAGELGATSGGAVFVGVQHTSVTKNTGIRTTLLTNRFDTSSSLTSSG
ncbi:MAG: hypothetical protein KTR25_01155 [Myxococcales bacterium]|nr:hypothetical protein [Myxococcales bacterium]